MNSISNIPPTILSIKFGCWFDTGLLLADVPDKANFSYYHLNYLCYIVTCPSEPTHPSHISVLVAAFAFYYHLSAYLHGYIAAPWNSLPDLNV